MNNTDYITIASLNQYSYCPHRCWRMYCLGEFTDNQYTIEGTTLHERVHTVGDNNQEETWQVRAIWLKSEKYNLIGKSDLIELENGEWYPVEYKRVKKGEWDNDELQVWAQALCLEEMTGKNITTGYVYYAKTHQRQLVEIDDDLRKETFSFKIRNRRPTLDPVNSLLSLGYSLLRHDIQSAINIVGFDPYLGYLHTQHYGRPSLALDLMEEFRPLIVDSVVLNAINRRIFTPQDFIKEPVSNAVSLRKEALHKFLRIYQEKKLSKFTHPVMKKQYTYQESFEIQARFLAKYLTEQIDKYPPLVMK